MDNKEILYFDDETLDEIIKDHVLDLTDKNIDENISKGKFKDVKSLIRKFKNYYRKCRELKKPITMSGLAIHLGMRRENLYHWAKREKSQHSALAKLVMDIYENQLVEGGLTGVYQPYFAKMVLQSHDPIFSDKKEIKQENSGSIQVEYDVTKFVMPEPETDN